MNKLNKKFSKGFGLLEVMVSAVIIIMILAALILVANAAIRNNQYVQMRAEATYLAQEGIERVRNIRDTNWIDGNSQTSWDNLTVTTAPAGVSVPNGCYKINTKWLNLTDLRYFLDNTVMASTYCNPYTNSNRPVEEIINYPENGHLLDKTAPANKYYRVVSIDKNNNTIMPSNVYPSENSIKVTVLVGFNFNGQPKDVSVSEIITNWRPDF